MVMKHWCSLSEWGPYLRGAKMMFYRLFVDYKIDLYPHIPKKKGKDAFNRAMFDWLMENPDHIAHFLSDTPRYFTDHKTDGKGKCISCRITLEDPRKKQKNADK